MHAPIPGLGLPRVLSLWMALLFLMTGCGRDDGNTGSPAKKPERPNHLVTLYSAREAPVATHHERPGSLRLRKIVRIFSQEEGRITGLDLFESDRVEEGQLIVQLEDGLLRAELDKIRATEALARLDLERAEGLRERRAVSEAELAQARTKVAVAEADERLFETRLAFTRIHAPFAGVITERLVEPGDFVTKNTHLLTLADPASLVAEIFASELVLPLVSVGDPVELRIDALGATAVQGTILRIHPVLQPTSRQGLIEVTLDPIPTGARAGQYIRAKLTTAEVKRLLVPFRALRRDRKGEFLWLLDADGKAVRRTAHSGLRIADRIEITKGLAPGERVVTRGFLGLSSGKVLTPVDLREKPR